MTIAEAARKEQALTIDCPECGACEGLDCYEIDPEPCSRCGYIGCRTIEVPTHYSRIEEAMNNI